MKINNFRKYIFGNIISILGYIALAYLLIYLFKILPDKIAYNALHNIRPDDDITAGFNIVGFFITHFFILLIAVFFVIVEIFTRKFFKLPFFKPFSIPTFIDKLYYILFWIGIILAPMSLYALIYGFLYVFTSVIFYHN